MTKPLKEPKFIFEPSMLPSLLFDALDRADFEVQKGEAPDSEGQWYTVPFVVKRWPPHGKAYIVCDFSDILSDFGTQIKIVEIGSATVDTVRVRVVNFVEHEKPRVRADRVSTNALRAIYGALGELDPTIPEFDQLSEAKRKIFASQISTLRLTMKM